MPETGCLISIVICTYNRANLLQVVLDSLCTQHLPQSEYEVIVVDNNSTDETYRVVEAFQGRLLNLRYYFKTELGISVARNYGWSLALGAYVGFTDDDVRLPAEWLSKAKQIIQMHTPAAFGGPYFACYDWPKPAWFRDSYGSSPLGDRPRVLTSGYLPGCNFFLRRDLLEVTGGFDPFLGVVGRRLGYGEEGALLQLIFERHPHEVVFYDPELYIYHRMRPEKMRLSWQLWQRFVNGRYIYRVNKASYLPILDPVRQCWRLARMSVRLFLKHPLRLLFRNRVQYPCYQHYLIESFGRDLQKFGGMVEQFQQTLMGRPHEDGRL